MQAFSFGETACIYLFLVFIGLTLERTHLLEKICVELGCVHSLPLPPMPPHVLMNFRGFPPGWCEWWYAGRWNTRRGLKPKSANYPDHGHHGNLSLQGKISHVRTGNRTRDLTISSQRPWPLDHEAGRSRKVEGWNFLSRSPVNIRQIFFNPIQKRAWPG